LSCFSQQGWHRLEHWPITINFKGSSMVELQAQAQASLVRSEEVLAFKSATGFPLLIPVTTQLKTSSNSRERIISALLTMERGTLPLLKRSPSRVGINSPRAMVGSPGPHRVRLSSSVLPGLTVGGQFGVAGSAGAAIGASGSVALGGAQAQNGQFQVGASQYEQQSVGANSFVYQAGQQEFGTATGSGAALVGVAGGAAGVYQAGGSVAVNDGNAGFMDGSATAAGEAWAVTGSAGIAGADAEAFGNQEHMYEQGSVSADGSNFQYQQGYVSTQVQAQSTSP